MSAQVELGLRLQDAIERRLNTLTASATALIDKTKVCHSEKMEESQMQNLVSVARETDSAEVVLNFILYQVGRDEKSKSWRHGDFGVELEKALRGLKGDAQQIAVQVAGEETPELVDEAWIRLMRHYVGQLRRFFYFRKKYEQHEEEQP
jgi:hypothetical protein